MSTANEVHLVPTPNPNAYMFRVHETLIPTGTHEYKSGESTESSPLAEQILSLPGVDLILIAPRFVTVRKSSETEWDQISGTILEKLEAFLESGEMAVVDSTETGSSGERTELEKKILELLDEEVRPAIAQDGGDVIFHGFRNGQVRLELIGACSSCPSSTATLHYGIQSLLMEEFPEVEGVEQVESGEA
jgi:Fe-S cluster biogenesis protein NfuA